MFKFGDKVKIIRGEFFEDCYGWVQDVKSNQYHMKKYLVHIWNRQGTHHVRTWIDETALELYND